MNHLLKGAVTNEDKTITLTDRRHQTNGNNASVSVKILAKRESPPGENDLPSREGCLKNGLTRTKPPL
jgi:hypothetical protein